MPLHQPASTHVQSVSNRSTHRTYERRDPASGGVFVQCECGATSPTGRDELSRAAWANAHRNGSEAHTDWWAAA